MMESQGHFIGPMERRQSPRASGLPSTASILPFRGCFLSDLKDNIAPNGLFRDKVNLATITWKEQWVIPNVTEVMFMCGNCHVPP